VATSTSGDAYDPPGPIMGDVRRQRRARIRDVLWFAPKPAPGARHRSRHAPDSMYDDKLSAYLYLVSVIATPIALATAYITPLDLPDAAYGISIAAASLFPWVMVLDVCAERGIRAYSWYGLKAQVWLQFGGAALPAIRHIRRRPLNSSQ
jgi:hypothetical protein